MLEQLIQKAIDAWTERGRNRGLLKRDNCYVLCYSRRFRFRHSTPVCSFAFFFILAWHSIRRGLVVNPNIQVFYLLLFGALTLLAGIYAIYALTSRVDISDERVSVRSFGLTISTCSKAELELAYKSPAHPSIILKRADGKKTRISTKFDGLRALVAWLWLRPASTLSDSIRDWMRTEAPDLYQPTDARESSDRSL